MALFPKDRDLSRPLESLELEVDPSFFRAPAAGFVIRLDHFLGAHLSWRSRSSIQELVRDGFVLVDAATPEHPRGAGRCERERRPGRKLRPGSRVRVLVPPALRVEVRAGEAGPLAILYEDDELLAVDKPPLIAVHPSGRHLADTLIQRVHARLRAEVEAGRLAPRLCHRLDRETSGVVLVGKRARSHAELRRAFERHELRKEYLAIVHGELAGEEGSVELPLAPSRASRIGLKMAVAADGLEARTDWRVVARAQGYTLLRCRLWTGRQHQIRVHLAALGHPVVGDKLYGHDDGLFVRALDGALSPAELARLELPRHALHHHRLVFRTPAGGGQVDVTSPLAPDLEAFWRERGGELEP